MIRESIQRRPDGSIGYATLDDGAGCYVIVSEGPDDVSITQRFEQGGPPLGHIKLTKPAALKLLPLLQDLAAREN